MRLFCIEVEDHVESENYSTATSAYYVIAEDHLKAFVKVDDAFYGSSSSQPDAETKEGELENLDTLPQLSIDLIAPRKKDQLVVDEGIVRCLCIVTVDDEEKETDPITEALQKIRQLEESGEGELVSSPAASSYSVFIAAASIRAATEAAIKHVGDAGRISSIKVLSPIAMHEEAVSSQSYLLP